MENFDIFWERERERVTTHFRQVYNMQWDSKRRYLVPNDTMSAVSNSNNREICLQKITTSLINERHVLVGSYFCIQISHLLYFDTNDVISFNTWYFFDIVKDNKFFNIFKISTLGKTKVIYESVKLQA